MYKLLGADGKQYLSETPGAFGGNSKQKIYGRLDCRSALSTIRRFPGSYEEYRGANSACDRNAGERSEAIIWKIKGLHHCPLWIRIQ